jgi:protein-L-isoaspartate(D-aspartate) O-methyltransferase
LKYKASWKLAPHFALKLTTKNTKDTKKMVGTPRCGVRTAQRAVPTSFAQRRRALFFIVRSISQFLILATLATVGCGQKQALLPQSQDFAVERQRMVQEQLMPRGIHDHRVLGALSKVPREEFVPSDERGEAYEDGPLPIGHGQTISQPYIVAFMTEQLRLKPSDRVLEIGTGSGYQAAVLAELAADVYTIEIIAPLAKSAEATLARLGYKNVHVKVGNGYEGWPEQGPFDAIIVTCAPNHVPQPLTGQLKDDGRMTIPVGERFAQELYLLEKKNGQLKQAAVLPVRFVPMEGETTKQK